MLSNKIFNNIYVIGSFIGFLFGMFIYAVAPVKWEASALVGIAKTYQPEKINITQIKSLEPSDFAVVEDMQTVIERLRSPSFLLAAAERAKENNIQNNLNNGNCSCIKAKPLKNNDALIISVSGNSSELAKNSVASIVEELKDKHNFLLEDYKTGIEAMILEKNHEADLLSKDLITLENRMQMDKSSFNQAIKDGMLLMIMQANLEKKINKSIQLRDLTSAFHIRQTDLLEPIWVTKKSLFSSFLRASIFGVLAGLFFSLCWVKLKN